MHNINAIAIDWQKVLLQSRQWRHSRRRKYIKKLKRSAKRKSIAISRCGSLGKDNICNVTDAERVDNKSQKCCHVFGSVYDCIVQETVLSVVKNIISLVSDNKNVTSYNVDLNIDPITNHGSVGVTLSNVSNERSSTAPVNVSSSSDQMAEVPRDKNNETAITENDDLLKTIETEKFLEVLDKEVKKWHNPFLPENPEAKIDTSVTREQSQPHHSGTVTRSSDQTVPVTRPKQICHFYEKVGSCRFGDNCSREHQIVDSSKTLLLSGMFSTFAFDILKRAQRSSQSDIGDLWMEYSDADLYDEFIEFYNDVIPELETYGKIVQFKVCCNRDKHLLGNVYVQYKHQKDAAHAFKHLNGRFYGGKVLNVKYILIKSWKSAICGLHYHNRSCPRGHHCNFLHVFKEPSRRFYDIDTDSVDLRHKRRNSNYSERSRHKRPERYDYREKRDKRIHSALREDSPESKRHKKPKHKKSSHKLGKKHKSKR